MAWFIVTLPHPMSTNVMISVYRIMIDNSYNLFLSYFFFENFFMVLSTKFKALYLEGKHTIPELQSLAFSFYLNKIFFWVTSFFKVY